jgi:serine/threonine protein kinase
VHDVVISLILLKTMRLIQTAHAYSGDFEVGEGDGAPKFTHSTYVFLEDSAFYFARCAELPGSYDPNSLHKSRVPLDIFPERQTTGHLTVAPDPLPENSHTKHPNLISYADKLCRFSGDQVRRSLLREVEVCELLRAHPHPNISEYLGCALEQDRITAACFVKYTDTLADRLREGSVIDHNRLINGIRDGLEHIHELGFCQNDLKDSNIMFKPDGTPVIIDFDSCQREGEKLEKMGTWNWGLAGYSSPKNDWSCFEQIRRLLARQYSDMPEECRF